MGGDVDGNEALSGSIAEAAHYGEDSLSLSLQIKKKKKEICAFLVCYRMVSESFFSTLDREGRLLSAYTTRFFRSGIRGHMSCLNMLNPKEKGENLLRRPTLSNSEATSVSSADVTIL